LGTAEPRSAATAGLIAPDPLARDLLQL